MAKKTTKVNKAKAIIRATTARGARRSTAVQAAVVRNGISVRTYRTARKSLRTIAIRESRSRAARGTGRWWIKSR